MWPHLKKWKMTRDPAATELETFSETPRNPSSDGPDTQIQPDEVDSTWDPSRKPLVSGLLGMNVFLLGAALVTGQAFNPDGLKNAEPQVFIAVLMGVGLIWMLWYLLWARKQPDISPHKDHHAGGITVTVGLLVFAALSLLVFIFRAGYQIHVSHCTPVAQVISPFIEAPFLALQVTTSSGLMVILSADLLLWLNAVTEDTIHEEIELEKAMNSTRNVKDNEDSDSDGTTRDDSSPGWSNPTR